MRAAVKPQTDPRPITAAEVNAWSACCRSPWPGEACTEIAACLTKMQWPGDLPPKPGAPPPDPTTEDPWWDTRAATAAVKALNDDIPAMLWHWERAAHPWSPETRDGYAAIKALRDALVHALPYVEWPFGKYERQTYRNRPWPSKWHIPAIVVAGIIGDALMKAGRPSKSTARDSVLVKIVRRALIRMGYPDIDTGTIAA
jgi:hypothetical protein